MGPIGGALLVLTMDEESRQSDHSFMVARSEHLCWQNIVLCIQILFTKFIAAINWKIFKSVIFED